VADILSEVGELRLWARITRHSLEEMEIKIDDTIYLTVKSVAILSNDGVSSQENLHGKIIPFPNP
jgi:hypothetical protein